MARKQPNQPRKGVAPPSKLGLPAVVAQKDPLDLRPILSFDLMDLDGPYCFSSASPRALQHAMGRLFNAIQTSYRDLQAGGSHFISVAEIIPEAQRRLEDINLNDYEQVYSLRCDGPIRVFGVRDGAVFHVLWLDEHHAICPSRKRNT